MAGPVELTLYSREGCHLCEDMLALLNAGSLRDRMRLTIVDVDADEDDQKRYGPRVPLLMYNGEVVSEYFLDNVALERVLTAAGQGTQTQNP